jgi:hypothetical protein
VTRFVHGTTIADIEAVAQVGVSGGRECEFLRPAILKSWESLRRDPSQERAALYAARGLEVICIAREVAAAQRDAQEAREQS